LDSPSNAQIHELILKAKTCPPGEKRTEVQKSIIRKARRTQQARPFQIAVLRDVGWHSTAQWLQEQPYAVSNGQGRPLYSPDQIKALNLPRVDERPTKKTNKSQSRSAIEKATLSGSTSAEQPDVSPRPATVAATAPAALEAGGALVVFDESIFTNVKRRVETSSWRVISADTYFLAEA